MLSWILVRVSTRQRDSGLPTVGETVPHTVFSQCDEVRYLYSMVHILFCRAGGADEILSVVTKKEIDAPTQNPPSDQLTLM